jgi:hypothetical protein
MPKQEFNAVESLYQHHPFSDRQCQWSETRKGRYIRLGPKGNKWAIKKQLTDSSRNFEWNTVLGYVPCPSTGRCCITFRVVFDEIAVVGLVDSRFKAVDSTQYGSSLAWSLKSTGYSSSKYESNRANGFVSGEILSLFIDMDTRTATICNEDNTEIVTWAGLPDNVYPAVSLHGHDDRVEMKFRACASAALEMHLRQDDMPAYCAEIARKGQSKQQVFLADSKGITRGFTHPVHGFENVRDYRRINVHSLDDRSLNVS